MPRYCTLTTHGDCPRKGAGHRGERRTYHLKLYIILIEDVRTETQLICHLTISRLGSVVPSRNMLRRIPRYVLPDASPGYLKKIT